MADNGSRQPLDRLRKQKRPASRRVGIVMDSSFQQRIDEAEIRVDELQERADRFGRVGRVDPDLVAELSDARDALGDARTRALEHTEWFVAKAMSPNAYDSLMAKHAPTKDQRNEARKNNRTVAWNVDTFPQALIEACVYLVTALDEPDPKTGEMERHDPLPADFVKEMFDGSSEGAQWNLGEVAALQLAAQEANQAQPQRVASLGNG